MRIREIVARAKSLPGALSRMQFPPVITTTWPGVPVFGDDGSWDGQLTDIHKILALSPSQLFRQQPHLRTVVDFLARNIAQLNIHAYKLAADGDRSRTTTDISARVFQKPNPHMTRYELIYALVGDLALYQAAYWMVTPGGPEGKTITPIPTAWMHGFTGHDLLDPDTYIVQPPNGHMVSVPAKLVERFHGWDPVYQHTGTSPVETLRMTLLEQVHSQKYREQQWKRGGRVGAVISRPPGHRWTPEQESKFMLAFRDAYAGDDAPEAGGIPILQDGMTMTRLGFSAKEDEYIEGTKLALTTVAGVFHINPTMLGMLDNANYSNVREFHRMLYNDTLGPWLSQLEDRFNTFTLPRLGAGKNVFVSFNIAEKLQGSFEEQAGVLSTSIGAPWMTRNEGRRLQNLPALEGGDDLITPLNVLVGGQASPQDGVTGQPGQQDVVEAVASAVVSRLKAAARAVGRPEPAALGKASARVKANARADHTAAMLDTLKRFLAGQRASVLSVLGAKADADWWNAGRWDGELAGLLYDQALAITGEIGPAAAREMGFDPDAYDVASTEAFLKAVAKSRASMINATTRSQVQAALADNDESHTPAKVFALAVGARAVQSACTLTTTFTAFSVAEAGKQAAPRHSTKTWLTTSGNSRPEHASMDGETVPVDENFSNGAAWPGDPSLGAAGVAGCECSISVQTEAR